MRPCKTAQVSPWQSPKRRGETGSAKLLPCWLRLLRAVLAWLAPAYWLVCCWAAFASAPLPAELAALLGALNAGYGINLYLRLVYCGCQGGGTSFGISRDSMLSRSACRKPLTAGDKSFFLRVMMPRLAMDIGSCTGSIAIRP
jgi:hypothetical protein